MLSINVTKTSQFACLWTPDNIIMNVCLCVWSPCTPVCVSVSLTVARLVAHSNSCYLGFLYKHVNKGEPPKSFLVCVAANQMKAPSWAQPVKDEEGRDSALWGKNSSKAQSFESGTGSDSRAITKTLPLWVDGTSHCRARPSGCGFLTTWLLHSYRGRYLNCF